MNRQQLQLEIRKELGMQDRLVALLRQYSKMTADAALRRSYQTNEPASLIRQSGYAEGIEDFIGDITQAPAIEPERG